MTAKRFRVNELVKYNYSEIGEYTDENHTDRPLRNDILVKLLNDLSDENEQLKQSNERLLKMLDNVANYMQRENKYMPIDDFVEWWNNIATKGLKDGDVE